MSNSGLVLLLVAGLTAVVRSAAADTTVTYNTPNGTITFDETTGAITGYSGTDTTLDIPATIDGVAVTSIGDNVFENLSNLTSIDPPSSLTSIGDYAFSTDPDLTSIDLQSSLTSIGDHAFWDSSLPASTSRAV